MLDTLNAILLAAEQGVRYEDYSICLKVFLILMVVAAVAIIVVIMMQKGTNDNGITGASDTYYGKNKSTNKESVLKKITFGLFAFILVCSIICFVMWGLIK